MSSLASYETTNRLDAALDKQLEALLVRLKDTIIIGIPYRAYDKRCACFFCGYMLGVYIDETPHCLRCKDIKWWTQEVKDRVAAIMRDYPEKEKKKPDISEESAAYGKKLKDARRAKGLSLKQLSRLLVNDKGNPITSSSVANFESGILKPSASVKAQLEQVLGLA